MNTLAVALLLFSLPAPRYTPPSREPASVTTTQHIRKGGRWYLAQSGHAVYCYGPVMTVTQPAGGLQRVATYCQGGETIVPLHD